MIIIFSFFSIIFPSANPHPSSAMLTSTHDPIICTANHNEPEYPERRVRVREDHCVDPGPCSGLDTEAVAFVSTFPSGAQLPTQGVYTEYSVWSV